METSTSKFQTLTSNHWFSKLSWYDSSFQITKCTRVLCKKCHNECIIQTTNFLNDTELKGDLWILFCELRSSRFVELFFSTFPIQISIFRARFWKTPIFCNLSFWLSIFHFRAAILEITLCHLFPKFWWFRLWWLNFDCRSFIVGHQTWKSWIHKPCPPFKNQTSKEIARMKFQNSKY